MGISHWSDPDARIAYERAYEKSLELWPIPYERRFLKTRFGPTHVVSSGTADGEPIVFLHAASLSATQWHAQAAYLGRKYRLHAVDIMGDIGLSIQTAAVHTRDDASAWVGDVLDGLDAESAIFIGSSFGGFHATNFAIHEPDRVRALVLLAPAATIKAFRVAANAIIRAGSLIPLPMTVRPALRGMMEGQLPDERIVRQMEIGVAGFCYDHAGIYPSELPAAELASVRCPVLVLLGDREMIYDAEAAASRARRAMPTAEVQVIGGVGHLLGLQRPVLINPRLGGFLAEIATGTEVMNDRSPLVVAAPEGI
jgi:pimeloyl-ACP methyl ester carboxylesterase